MEPDARTLRDETIKAERRLSRYPCNLSSVPPPWIPLPKAVCPHSLIPATGSCPIGCLFRIGCLNGFADSGVGSVRHTARLSRAAGEARTGRREGSRLPPVAARCRGGDRSATLGGVSPFRARPRCNLGRTAPPIQNILLALMPNMPNVLVTLTLPCPTY